MSGAASSFAVAAARPLHPTLASSVGDTGAGPDAADFRLAMRRLPGAVSIVATRHAGVSAGMVATSVASLCADPPSLTVGIGHGVSMYPLLMKSGRFSVNVLTVRQENLIALFSGALKGEARFAHGGWAVEDELPVLPTAQATFVCEVADRLAYGAHDVVVGRILAIRNAAHAAPLIWQDGAPHASRRLAP